MAYCVDQSLIILALPSLVAGLRAVALSTLPRESRIAAAELLVTLAEGAPKMCMKLAAPSYASALLDALLPMLLRLSDETASWEAGEPEDGLTQGDEDDGDEREATFAPEALDRLGAALDGIAQGGPDREATIARSRDPTLPPSLVNVVVAVHSRRDK